MALDTTLRMLAGFAAFRGIEAEALRLLALSADTRILRVGEVLFRRGEPADGALIVLGGSVELRGVGEPVTVRPPTLLGETALIVETRRPVTATTREPASVLRVSRALYLRVLSEYPRSAKEVHRRTGQARLAVVASTVPRAPRYPCEKQEAGRRWSNPTAVRSKMRLTCSLSSRQAASSIASPPRTPSP